MDNLTKKDISEVYSVSCVERYVLAYLKKIGINIRLLYCNSYMSTDHLISDFTTKKETYANYGAMARIQDVASEFGIIVLEGRSEPNLDFLRQDDSEYLLEMKQGAFMSMYEKESWREDHFFYIKKKSDDTYLYLNDIPLQEKLIDINELTQLYNHRYIVFKYIKDQIGKDEAFMRFSDQYERENHFENCEIEHIEYETLRDLVCMLRISRKRTSDFLAQWKEPNPEWVNRVNNIFSKIEYSRVRKRYNSEIFLDEIDNLRRDEKEIGMYLQEIRSIQLQGGK